MNKERIEQMVQDSIDKVFHNDTRENVGEIENHSSDSVRSFYQKLSNDDPAAIKEQEERHSRITKMLQDSSGC